MIDIPEITETAEQKIAVIPIVVVREEMRNVMGPGLTELMTAMAVQDIAPVGSWFTHHLKMSPERFDFEIGVPVTTPVAEIGRVKPGQRPAMKVARTVYHGPYEGLSDAWQEFDAWIIANGHQPASDLWETYVLGPESNADPAAWCTELCRPLLS